MAYIGDKPSQTLASPTSQYFNGDGSTVAFTLNRAVNVAEDLEVFVNNVQQEPGVGKSYTATGTTLTFDAAPSAGTANVYVVYRGLAEVTTRLEHDPNAALAATTGTFSGDLTVDTNTLYVDSTNNRVGVGTTSGYEAFHVKVGASGQSSAARDGAVIEGDGHTGLSILTPSSHTANICFGDESDNDVGQIRYLHGDNAMTFTANAAERMRIDSSGRVTMPYQPLFSASDSRALNITGSVLTTSNCFNQIDYNVGGHFNGSNGRFTAPVAGYYDCTFHCSDASSTGKDTNVRIRKNGVSNIGPLAEAYNQNGLGASNVFVRCIVQLSVGDYIDYEATRLNTTAGIQHKRFIIHMIG